MDNALAKLSDPELVVRIREGEKRAFEAFYLRYHAHVYHLSLRFLKKTEPAEEAVQDVFLKFWQNRAALDPGRSAKGYLLRSCKNHLINELAKKGARFESIHTHSDEIAGMDSPVDDLVFSEYAALLDKGIASLPAQRQRVFRMYRLENKNLEEIAAELGTSKGTVKDHLLKAHRYLRTYVKNLAGIRIDMLLLFFLWL
ncbi:RNA polymerase sigma-70 factor [Ravibacter arvi]|uniref:RNA polymerase sigma-70 factor n=1 Tax=Ravibacter arvi TaxID=2051041 RepID=A0ABP8M5G9_9BACT